MDRVEVYHKDIHNAPGIYFIQSNNYFPLRCNGWYFKPMVDYCLENNTITHENIKYMVQAQLTIQSDNCNEFIEKCHNKLPEDLLNLSVNSMIGKFKPNVGKYILTTPIFITSDGREAMLQNIQSKRTFIKHFEVKEKDYFHVFKL